MNQEILEQIRHDAPGGWWAEAGAEIAFATKVREDWVLCARHPGCPWFVGVAGECFLYNEHGKAVYASNTQDITTEFMRLVSILLSEEKEVSQRED